MRRKTFSFGRTKSAVRVYVKMKGRIVDRLPRKHIVFYDTADKRVGHLRDGRPVIYEDGKWIYYADESVWDIYFKKYRRK